MKKSLIFAILFAVILVVLVVSLVYHLIFFNNFRNNVRPASDSEKQNAIEILNQSMNVNDYQIKFGNIYTHQGQEYMQVELIKGTKKKYYSIDINQRVVIGR